MYLLGLDLGTSTGWAMSLPDGTVMSGTERFAVARGESPGMRFLRFTAWLDEITTDWPSGVYQSVVGYEQPHHRGGASTEVLVGMSTAVQSFCANYDYSHTSVHTGLLKKFATGDGRASKIDMAKKAEHRFDHYQIPDDFDKKRGDDEADALWVLAYMADTLGQKVG